MAGAPSQLDLFDHKPELAKLEGKPLPPSVIMGQRYAFIRPDANVLGPVYQFSRHGQCGMEISEIMPKLGEVMRVLRDPHRKAAHRETPPGAATDGHGALCGSPRTNAS
jgi:hypothetical protein